MAPFGQARSNDAREGKVADVYSEADEADDAAKAQRAKQNRRFSVTAAAGEEGWA